MNKEELAQHIEADSILILAMDEKIETITPKEKEIFLKHLSLCNRCQTIYKEAKQDLKVLENTPFEDAPLPPELAHLASGDFIKQTINRFKENDFVVKQDTSQEIKLTNIKVAFAVASASLALIGLSYLGLLFIRTLEPIENTEVLVNTNSNNNVFPNLPDNINPTNQNSNDNQKVKPIPSEEKAEVKQKQQPSPIVQNPKKEAKKQSHSVENKQLPITKTPPESVQEIAVLTEPYRATSQRTEILIKQPLLRIPVNLGRFDNSYNFKAILLEEKGNTQIWSSKKVKPFTKNGKKIIKFTIPTENLTSGQYTLKIYRYSKPMDEAETVVYYLLITNQSVK